MTLSGVSVRRPVLAGVLSALIVVFGLLAFRGLPLRELPDVDPPIVSVTTSYPGANAEVVENRVTQIVEDQLNGIEGIDTITSQSRDGRSNIQIQFNLNRDLEAATNDVRDAVARVADRLPEEVDAPEVAKQDADARPIMWFSLSSDERDVAQLTDYARRFIIDRLSVIDGVSFVIVGGGQDYAMRIWIDRRALAARELTVDDIETALRAQNVELPAGEIEGPATDLTVRVQRDYLEPADFARLPLGDADAGYVTRLGDVARVEVGPRERRATFRGNGQTRVGLGIVRQSKSNSLEVGRLVKEQVERINDTLPDDMAVSLSFDGTLFVERAIDEVWRTLAIALALVVGVIYLFLGSIRAALIPAAVVPVALVGVFVVLAAFGFSLNILTLLAMVLAIGLVVDDSIVVLENIQRRVDKGEPRAVAADRGARQVFFAVVATTAVIVSVFAPLTVLPGYTGRIFVELAVTIAGAVIISSFVALTLSPMMSSLLLKPATQKALPAKAVDWALNGLRDAYCGALSFLLTVWPLTLAIVGAALAGAWFLSQSLPSEPVPPEDRGSMFMGFNTSEGAGFDHTVEQALKIEDILLEYVESGEVNLALVRVPGFGGTGFNSGIAIIILADWAERDRSGLELVGELNRRIGEVPGVRGFVGMRSALGGGGGDDVQFVIQGPDYPQLADAAERLIAAARENPNLLRLRADYQPTSPRLIVDIDRERAADLGVSAQTIGRTLETQLGSRRVGTYVDGGEEYDVILQNEIEDRSAPTDLSNIFVRSQTSGQLIPLSNLVSLDERGEAAARPRVNRLRAVTVTATLEQGYSLGEAVEWLTQWAQNDLGPGQSYDFVGTAREFQDSTNALQFAFIMALVICFLVLAAQFESFVHPFVIMLTVPLAAVGGLFGLVMLGSSLNIYSAIGLIILIGLAAKNGILIVEFANQLRDAGRTVREAVLEAAEVRFRPILMTGVSTSIGALPLVLASGAGAESRQTIGVVIFAGVLLATIFTLVVVPVFYNLLAGFTRPTGYVAKEIAAYERRHGELNDEAEAPA